MQTRLYNNDYDFQYQDEIVHCGLMDFRIIIFWFKYDLGQKLPTFDQTEVQTHDLKIMTVQFMSLRCRSNH